MSIDWVHPAEAAASIIGVAPEVIEGVLRGLSADAAFRVAAHLPAAANDGSGDTLRHARKMRGTVADLMQPPVAVLKQGATASSAVDEAEKLTGVVVMLFLASRLVL